MSNYLLAFYSSALPGRDAEYLDWYRDVHLAEICGIPGVKSGRVFEAHPASPAKPAATQLALYELDVDDPVGVLQEMNRRGHAGEMSLTDAIDVSSVQISVFKQNF